MKMSTLRLQLRTVEDNILTTQLGIGRLERLVARLAENHEERLEAERQLAHLRCVQSEFAQIRSGLIMKFESFHPAVSPRAFPGIVR